MPEKTYVYTNKRPLLTIECTGGRALGNCYSASYWRVTSTNRLTAETLRKLNAAGVLGFGQEFTVRSQADGKEERAGEDELSCVVFRDGKPTDEPPVNPYSRNGELYQPIKSPFFVYECESRCDSGD